MGIREDYMSMEKAEVGNLQDLLSRIGAGLDEFLKFEHADALAQQNAWKPVLDIALPELGVGIDEVTRELVENIIPFGSPVTKPGFTSFITTGATSASTLASAAASIASPQRYLPTAFNFIEELSLDWLNQKIHRRLIRENEYLPSTTRIKGQLALRPSFLGARTDDSQVDGLAQAVLRIGDALVTEPE